MTSKRLITAAGRYREYVYHDPDDDMLWVGTEEDCADIIKEAKQIADGPVNKDFRHVAKIPRNVLDRAFREGWFHDKIAWKKWANEPDNAAFRTWRGRL